MGWLDAWWQEIGMAGRIMACAAVPATIVTLLQLILLLVGLGGDTDFESDSSIDAGYDGELDSGIDTDTGIDGGFDASSDVDGTGAEQGAIQGHQYGGGVKLFTVRGITAFFAIGGWAGLAAITGGIPWLWAVQLALLAGAAAMLTASFAIRLALRMQSSGNIDPRNALSHTATVYITIPPLRKDTGRVTMLLQERFVELEAMTDCQTAIRPNTKVKVVGLSEGCLVVSPAGEEDAATAAPDKDIELGG